MDLVEFYSSPPVAFFAQRFHPRQILVTSAGA